MTEQAERMPEIQGRCIKLESGATVWGGLHNKSIVWRFKSKSGATTDLVLSREAMGAVVHIFQGLIGCDHDFASVGIMPPESVAGDET